MLLLVEVSNTTLDYDRGEKLSAYGVAGLAEVWIVNVNDRAIEVYRDPQITRYASKTVYRPGQQAYPQALPEWLWMWRNCWNGDR